MKRTIKYLTLLAATALSMSSTSNSYAQTTCKNQPVSIHITAGPLGHGLTDLSRQIVCRLHYKVSLVEKLQGNQVDGKYLPFEGVVSLIKGTGLEVHPVKDGFELNQIDQNQIGLKAAVLQAALGQAVKSQKIKQNIADAMFLQLSKVRTAVVSLAKSQGFVSAAEKASFERTFKQTQQLLPDSI